MGVVVGVGHVAYRITVLGWRAELGLAEGVLAGVAVSFSQHVVLITDIASSGLWCRRT